jgi:hypothetical protein
MLGTVQVKGLDDGLCAFCLVAIDSVALPIVHIGSATRNARGISVDNRMRHAERGAVR